MIRKLLKLSNFNLSLKFKMHSMHLITFILLGLLGSTQNKVLAQNTSSKNGSTFTAPQEAFIYDFNACRSFAQDNSNYDYSEFTPIEGTSCAGALGSQLYRHAGAHSCTSDAMGNQGKATCFQSSTSTHFIADAELAIRFDVVLNGSDDGKSRLDGISFEQFAPHEFLWNTPGSNGGTTGTNNYPTKFGLRVLKDGVEVYSKSEMNTSQSWTTSSFNFNQFSAFEVASGTSSTFSFELFSYAPIGNGANVSVWDLDNLKIRTSCEERCNLSVEAGDDQEACDGEEITLTANAMNESHCPDIVSMYKITDATTGSCFPTQGSGVIMQRGQDGTCQGGANSHTIWKAGNDLTLTEYADGTAAICGTVENNGQIGIVNIQLADKSTNGFTWNGSCYVSGLSDDRMYYATFSGSITVNGEVQTIERKASETPFVLADGAGFDPNQFGIGAWTTGSFGVCTEWFGNLTPMSTPQGSLQYLWSTGETTPSITVTESGDYTVTVTDCAGCDATDTVNVSITNVSADAGDDVTICSGDEVTLSVTGDGTYEWSTGETTKSITVNPAVTTTYSVFVTNGECQANDDIIVTVEDKVIIGDFVWNDENRNGLQDDGSNGINGVQVSLYQCDNGNNTDGSLIDSTETTNNASGEPGYYQFEVCQDSGDYYIVFTATPDGFRFTDQNNGDTTVDSNADANGMTNCFTITDQNDLTIDAGLLEICALDIDAGADTSICADEVIELTATFEDATAACEGGCVYPIKEQNRCAGPSGDFEIYLESPGSGNSFKFKASEQNFETFDDGSARYTATATNGVDTIEIDALFTGYTTVAPIGSPKLNDCQQYDTSEYQYWTNWSGTLSSQNHGVYTLSVRGAAFQLGEGADERRSGLGASGWFSLEGGDGTYTVGDVNVALDECIKKGVQFNWTTEDGTILGDANLQTISISAPGTYVVEISNCIDCTATDTIIVDQSTGCKTTAANSKQLEMLAVYPVPVQSGGVLTIELDTKGTPEKVAGPNLLYAKTAADSQTSEQVGVMVYDMTGKMISTPRNFEIINGKAIIYLDIDHLPAGKYIVRAQSANWSNSKNILVK